MIKNVLVDSVRDRLGAVSTKDVAKYVAFVFDEIEDALEREEVVKIMNFGVMETRSKRARIGRNPKTLVEAEISARRVVRFRMSKVLDAILNDGRKADAKSDEMKK